MALRNGKNQGNNQWVYFVFVVSFQLSSRHRRRIVIIYSVHSYGDTKLVYIFFIQRIATDSAYVYVYMKY